jgi:hypothetical protein
MSHDDIQPGLFQRSRPLFPFDTTSKRGYSVERENRMIREDRRSANRDRKHALSRRAARLPRERLVWLLDFAGRANQVATVRGEELERLRFDVWSFPVRTMTYGDQDELSVTRIAELARRVSHGIRSLLRGEPWRLRVGPITLYLDLKDGRPISRNIANHREGFLLEAHDLVAAEAKRLRQCQRAECRRVFVANRRQVFCGARCSQNERTERFLAKHSREELGERRHARYVEKVKRTKGPAVAKKVRRRRVPANQEISA